MKNFIFVPYITKHLAQNYELKQADLFYANLFTSLEASASFMKIEERSLFITSPYPFEIFPLVLEKKAAVVAGWLGDRILACSNLEKRKLSFSQDQISFVNSFMHDAEKWLNML